MQQRGLDARESRLWNYFTRQDDFWPIREWPEWAREAALLHHKKYRERYRLFLFWTFNGLNPFTARMWLIMNDYKNGRYIEEHYDRGAWSQIDGMVRAALNSELYINREPRKWDPIRQKWVGGMYDMILRRPD